MDTDPIQLDIFILIINEMGVGRLSKASMDRWSDWHYGRVKKYAFDLRK